MSRLSFRVAVRRPRAKWPKAPADHFAAAVFAYAIIAFILAFLAFIALCAALAGHTP